MVNHYRRALLLACILSLSVSACHRTSPALSRQAHATRGKPAVQAPQKMTLFRTIINNTFGPASPDLKDSAPPPRDVSRVPNAVPKYEPRSQYGNPPSYKVFGKQYRVMRSAVGYKERGIASWYGSKFHNHRTSSGEPYNVYGMSAAHRSLPLPTYARVTNLENGKQVIVKVNDRGPFHSNRVIDLSYAAAQKLGIFQVGTGLVEVEAIDIKHPGSSHPEIKRSHRLFIQVGAFSQRHNATQFAQRVADATHHEVQLVKIAMQKQTLYRVLVGPVKTVTDSDKLARMISQKGFGRPITLIQ